MRLRHCMILVFFLLLVAACGVASGESAHSRLTARMAIKATVSGRKFLFFSFKGMLLAEAAVAGRIARSEPGILVFTSESPLSPNFILMTTNRKASEVVAMAIGEAEADAVRVGAEAIQSWGEDYPEWSRDVSEAKRKSLPFLLDAPPADGLLFTYRSGLVSETACHFMPKYAWRAKKPLPLPLFDALASALALFNHSPFPDDLHASMVTRRFPVAPVLRDVCLTILPGAKSEVEFTEKAPLEVLYRVEPHEGKMVSLGEETPHRPIEKSFNLDRYRREATWMTANRALVSDHITIELSGKKGNSAEISVSLQPE